MRGDFELNKDSPLWKRKRNEDDIKRIFNTSKSLVRDIPEKVVAEPDIDMIQDRKNRIDNIKNKMMHTTIKTKRTKSDGIDIWDADDQIVDRDNNKYRKKKSSKPKSKKKCGCK